MKKLILFSLLVVFTASINAQLIEKEDGRYYDHNDKLYTGTYIEYYNSGDKRIEMTVLNGEKHGITTMYFENQQKQEVRSFKHNKMDGTWITWNQDGTQIGEAGYKDDVKHGKWVIWDENGTMRYEMTYSNGEKSGTWKIYNENGELVSKRKY
ncbi:toxin-antitoxin system YwqK family antitoxin [Marinilabiliaceae bacterium JC017]|nr:toxin-antitoxin system YwqK family antitoxin [Marinilabiliaceae bacterium JC017]